MIGKKGMAVAMALLLGGISQAHAATYNLGDVTAGESFTYGNIPVSGPSFNDDFTFNVTGNLDIGSLFFDASKTQNLSKLMLTLFQGATQISNPSDVFSTGKIATLVDQNLSGPGYSLHVTGNTGAKGAYAGTIGFTAATSVSPVPVPPAFVLLGSALGGLFCVGRRRKEDADTPAA
jgi:hypothetical protein